MFFATIVGRPNVGKSTLFNKLVGKKIAIVDKTPGVTRDRRQELVSMNDMDFFLIDTAGYEENTKDGIEKSMMDQTLYAADHSDVILFLLDGKDGLTPVDERFAKVIRKSGNKVILIVNKSEGKTEDMFNLQRLGFGEPTYISAEHNLGLNELYNALYPLVESKIDDYKSLQEGVKDDDSNMQISIVGRPNTGKSTLINYLLDEDRVITGDKPGVTRDSIFIDWEYEGKKIRLVDTAGIRRSSNISEKLEKLSVANSMYSIKYAHVVVMLLDATAPLEQQDMSIMRHVIDEGRSLVIAINKWDKIKNKNLYLKWLEHNMKDKLYDVTGVPILMVSALNGSNCYEIIDQCFAMYENWNKRVSTSKLNIWMKKATDEYPAALGKNKRKVRIKYVTQINIRPPTFLAHMNIPENIDKSYIQYIVKGIRAEFGLEGVPIRFLTKKIANPYVDKK